MEFENNTNLDSLLDDPVEQETDIVEEEATVDEEPWLPDQPGDPDFTEEPRDESDEDDLITSYLKSHGIVDPKKIKFESEEGSMEEIDFNTLSKEDQLTMLKDLGSSDYTDYERQVIDYLREVRMDLPSVIKYFQDQAIQQFLTNNPDKVPQRTYKIDDYSDDELYIADLKIKFPDFSDDELLDKLESAKMNSELFSKEVNALREYYKKDEETRDQEEREQAELAEQQQYEQLRNTLLNAANHFTEIRFDTSDTSDFDGFEIEDSDRQRALDYLLALDSNNESQFDKDLSDPNALFALAYLRTSGRDLINQTSQYYKKLLADTRKDLAKAKKDLEKYEKSDNSRRNVTVQKPKESRTIDAKTVYDIWG